jgi:long-chain acyl-CoA synthetase
MYQGLRAWADKAPDRTALIIDGARPVSFAGLEGMANRFAHLIAAEGLVRGDHMAALLGNGAEAIALSWAAYRSGVYLTPLHTTLTSGEVAYVIRNSTSRLVLADASYTALATEVADLCPDVRFLSLNGSIEALDAAEPLLDALPTTPRSDECPGALMLYSSGTTGAPKGILRHLPPELGETTLFGGDLVKVFGFNAQTRYLSTQPMYHAAALRYAIAVSAAGGMSVVMPAFDAARALELIDAHDITLSQWVPTMFRRLLALPEETRTAFRGTMHSRAIHGAAPITPALKRAMIDWWGPIIEEYYSGSEGIGLSMINSAEWLSHPGSVGTAKKGVIHILDPDDREVPTGETGRVFFSGSEVFEYFNEPDKTAGKTSQQGWQTFGDIGFVDAEGYLYLVDREDDLILSGGVNVYPQEIEAALEDASFISEAGVIGAPDPDFDERPVAFVVPVEGETDIEPRLRAHIATRLGRIKQPRDIYVVDELPHSGAGKLLRRALRALLPS